MQTNESIEFFLVRGTGIEPVASTPSSLQHKAFQRLLSSKNDLSNRFMVAQ